MSFWGDVSNFFGNATHGLIGESDEERRRRQEEERRRQQQQQQFKQQYTPKASVNNQNSINQFNSQRNVVNFGLDNGQSYEDIAKHTGLSLDSIRDYADTTRPGYGVKKTDSQENLDKIKNFGSGLISGTEKVADVIGEITGATDRKRQAIDTALQSGQISPEQAHQQYQELLGDTAWAGTGYRPDGTKENVFDQAKKAAGVSLEATSELAPVPLGSLAKGGSLLARTGRAALEGGIAGGVGTAGSDIVETGSINPTDIAQGVLLGAATGGVMPGAGRVLRKGGEALDDAARAARQAEIPPVATHEDYQKLIKQGYSPQAIVDMGKFPELKQVQAPDTPGLATPEQFAPEPVGQKNQVDNSSKDGLSLDTPLTKNDMKDIITTHRQRFGDDGVQMINRKDSPGNKGQYEYQNDMISLVDGKANLDTLNHESVHKAIGQFLTDNEIEQLYRDIVKGNGGKLGLTQRYRKEGYPDISWRGAAEEEIANQFMNFVKEGRINRWTKAGDAAVWAEKHGLPKAIADIFWNLHFAIKKHYSKYDPRLENFYKTLNEGGFNGAPRRQTAYKNDTLGEKVGNFLAPVSNQERALGTSMRFKKDGNLVDNTDARARFANRSSESTDLSAEGQAAVAKQEINKRIAALPKAEYVSQMASRFNLQPATVARLLKMTNKADLFHKLNDNAEFLKGARIPDAAATSIINKAVKEGKAAAVRGGVATEKPSVAPENPTPVSGPQPTGELGHTVTNFYHANKGDKRVKFKDIENLGKTISNQVDAEFKAIGSSTQKVFKTVQALANKLSKDKGVNVSSLTHDQQVSLLKKAGLNDAEISILEKVNNEMKQIRRRASIGGKRRVGKGNFGLLYLPQQKVGSYPTVGSLLRGFLDETPGNENVRRGAIKPDELDYTASTIGSYVTRYADTKLTNKERVNRSLAEQHPDADEKTLVEATNKIVDLQDRINNIKRKAFGSSAGKVDSVKEMSEVGKILGAKQTVITDTPKARLEIGKRVNSVNIHGKPAGDYLGLNQFRDAKVYSHQQYTATGGDRKALVDAVTKRLKSAYDLPKERTEAYGQQISRIAENVPDEIVRGKIEQVYRQAAKEQYLANTQKIDIKSNSLRRDISELANQQLRGASMENRVSRKLVNGINMARNASFRKLNIGSAINELSDLPSFVSVLGRNINFKPPKGTLEKWGLGRPDPAIEPYIDAISEANGDWKSLKGAFKNANNLTNFYHAVEHYKAAVFLHAAEKHYAAQGLKGDALTKAVLDSYRELVLPVDTFTKTFLDNAPLFSQYMTWAMRNMSKEARLAVGAIDEGVLKNKSQMGRIARNAYANLPAKTVLWLASNSLKGTAIITAIGLTDYSGASSGDFSGIQDDDKNGWDNFINWLSTQSPFGSLVADVYDGLRRQELKGKYANSDYNPYKDANLSKEIGTNTVLGFVPGNSQVGRTVKAYNEQQQGYATSKDGRIRYQTPTDVLGRAQGLLFGNSTTPAGREYTGSENAVQRMKKGDNILSAVGHQVKTDTTVSNAVQALIGKSVRDYNRPLSDSTIDGGFNKAAQDAVAKAEASHGKNSPEARKVLANWIALGRKYNKLSDHLKKNDPATYATWQKTFDDNIISPEKWGIYKSHPELFKFSKERKTMEAKDLGRSIDPIYKLGDQKKINTILAIRSAFTGDDTKLREPLYDKPWYQKFNKEYGDYINKMKQMPKGAFGDFGQTKRAVDYFNLSQQRPKYPNLYQKYITLRYGDANKGVKADEAAGKAFYRNNADALNAEKDQYNKSLLAWTNKMRKMEGAEPLTMADLKPESSSSNSSGKGYYNSYYNYYGNGPKKDNGLSLATLLALEVGGHGQGLPVIPIDYGDLVDVTKVVPRSRSAKGMSPIKVKI